MRVEHRPKAGEDAALPVDERAVAVERGGPRSRRSGWRAWRRIVPDVSDQRTPGRPCGPRSCATRPASAWRPVRTRCRSGRSRRRRASRSPRPASSRSPCSPGLPVRAGRRRGHGRGGERRRRDRGAPGHAKCALRRPARAAPGRGGLRRLGAAHLVIDESTAMATARDDPRAGRLGFWATGLAVFVCWNTGRRSALRRERPRRSALARPRRGSARGVPRARRAAAPASRDGDRGRDRRPGGA